jgi:hypothetical protein
MQGNHRTPPTPGLLKPHTLRHQPPTANVVSELPGEQWVLFIPNAHHGYITFEQFEAMHG